MLYLEAVLSKWHRYRGRVSLHGTDRHGVAWSSRADGKLVWFDSTLAPLELRRGWFSVRHGYCKTAAEQMLLLAGYEKEVIVRVA